MRLDDAGYCDTALGDRELALAVARHKAIFFREKDVSGDWIDYVDAVSGQLQLVPEPPLFDTLADDYDRMRRDGMLLEETDSFEDVVNRCAAIETRANER